MFSSNRRDTQETPEERRNRILRVRCGEVSATGRPKDDRKSPIRIAPGISNDFVVVGQTMNPFTRLSQISPRDFTTQKRQLANGERKRISFMAFNSLTRSVDDLHIMPGSPACAAGMDTDDVITEVSRDHRDSKNRRSSCGLLGTGTGPRTAPTGIDQRRWSDSAAEHFVGPDGPSGGSVPSQTTKDSHAKALGLQYRPMNLIKSDSACFTQNADELLQEYKEFARRKEGITELRKGGSDGVTMNEEGRIVPMNSPKEEDRDGKSPKVNISGEIIPKYKSRSNGLPNATSVTGSGRPKPQRRQTTNMSLYRNKRGVLMPSGDPTGQRYPSTENLPASSKTGGSATRMLQKRSSRMLGTRRSSVIRKSETNMKNKKVPPRPESPPVPTEEDMQEIQDLPVIRKFLKMPPSRPKVVCFDYPGVDLTHMDVKRAIEKVIPDGFESGKVVSVQFENVNVKLATGGLDNRWLVELRDFATRNLLIKNGLTLDSPATHSLVDLKIAAKKPDDSSTSGDEEEFITFPPINYPKKVPVKLNDSVSMEEYKLYLRRTAAEEKLQNVILLSAGRGDKLLTAML